MMRWDDLVVVADTVSHSLAEPREHKFCKHNDPGQKEICHPNQDRAWLVPCVFDQTNHSIATWRPRWLHNTVVAQECWLHNPQILPHPSSLTTQTHMKQTHCYTFPYRLTNAASVEAMERSCLGLSGDTQQTYVG